MNASTPAVSAPFESASPRVFNPWLIALAVVVPTFMEVLDTTIANVTQRHIGDGRIEHLHKSRHHHCQRNEPRVKDSRTCRLKGCRYSRRTGVHGVGLTDPACSGA